MQESISTCRWCLIDERNPNSSEILSAYSSNNQGCPIKMMNAYETHFSALKDPRINRKKLYPLIEILFVVLCGSICGAESWRDFVWPRKS